MDSGRPPFQTYIGNYSNLHSLDPISAPKEIVLCQLTDDPIGLLSSELLRYLMNPFKKYKMAYKTICFISSC